VSKAQKSESRGVVGLNGEGELRPALAQLRQMGKSLREACPRSSHAAWIPPHDRRDPIELLEASNKGRIKELIPIRYGRMMQSAFAWFRGAALTMAADLATTPASGLRVQACGDCHLLNFGAFATPERRVIFDINDLDETLPAPWEWDVKRLATSFVLACRNNGFSSDCAKDAARACVRSYRERMAEFSAMPALNVWYASVDMDAVIPTIRDEEARRRAQKRLDKARDRSAIEHDFPELAQTDGQKNATIRDNPPLIFHWREHSHEEEMAGVVQAFGAYRDSLLEHRRLLLDRYALRDIAIKVVGIGSVGTFCGILLLMANENDPLFLQLKQARRSVLEAYAGKSHHKSDAQRIVVGTHIMQSASDVFLGWTVGQKGRQFYVRQLRDVKVKMLVEVFSESLMMQYAELCGWCLARAHARSGEPAKITGYLGKSDTFDEAIADFAAEYADQTERDYEVFMSAVRAGKLEVYVEQS
jgi:uncharacterized protein (DUF2252 family)